MAKSALFVLLLLISAHTIAMEIPAEIEACLKRNLPASTSVQSI
jgi:hypothetical protein